MTRAAAPLAALLAFAACGGSQKPCTPGGDGSYVNSAYDSLDQYCVVDLAQGQIVPKPGVLPYDLNTPLFSDYALKLRAVWMPLGASATYDASGVFQFPTGALLIKSFGFRDDLRKAAPGVRWIETRLLVRTATDWQGYTYEWNDAQTRATLNLGGGVRPQNWLDDAGQPATANYLIPSFNQCKQCHTGEGKMDAIGPKARNLNRIFAYSDGPENQFVRWTKVGFLTGAPDPASAPALPVWNDPATGSTEARARAYLEVNCAHCHSATGAARTTGLILWASEADSTKYGVCKSPVAAGEATGGFRYDVVPGDPDHSVLNFRLASTEPSIAMPIIGRSAVDKEGLALVRDWITGLPPGPCSP